MPSTISAVSSRSRKAANSSSLIAWRMMSRLIFWHAVMVFSLMGFFFLLVAPGARSLVLFRPERAIGTHEIHRGLARVNVGVGQEPAAQVATDASAHAAPSFAALAA